MTVMHCGRGGRRLRAGLEEGSPALYLCGKPLGLQPLQAAAEVEHVPGEWRRRRCPTPSRIAGAASRRCVRPEVFAAAS